MVKLILLFTIVPLSELAILIKLNQWFGLPITISLIAGTGILGAILANQQQTTVASKIKASIAQGQMPADELIEGLLILIGSICLITPGLITDLAGFLFILPFTRPWIKQLTKAKFNQLITAGEFQFKPKDQTETRSVDIDYSEE